MSKKQQIVIYKTGELDDAATLSKMEAVQQEGKRNVQRTLGHYSLDMNTPFP